MSPVADAPVERAILPTIFLHVLTPACGTSRQNAGAVGVGPELGVKRE